jgi:hypothetical protein
MHGSSQARIQNRLASTTRLALIGIMLALTAACELGSPSTPSSPAPADMAAALGYCADEINHYRATIGRPSLSRSTVLEDFAARAAEADGTVHVAHHLFSMTNGGGMAMAETEILWWRGVGVRGVIQKGLAQMWQSGSSGEHYGIIAGPYTQVGCGVFVNGTEVTVAQDFR